MGAAEPDLEFDLRTLNLNLNQSKRRLAVVSWGFALFLAAVACVLTLSYVPLLLNRSIAEYQFLTFIVAVPVLVALVVTLARGLRWKKPGAEWIRLSPHRLEVAFPGRPSVVLDWSDPKLQFELHDYSGVRSEGLSIFARYFLLIGGTDSALTPEAFRAIEDQIAACGLLEQVESASQWRAPSGVKVYSIRAKPR
jgi:hypothetical protein